MRLLRLTFLLFLAAATAAAQPYLVKDLNTTIPDFVSLRPLAAADSYLFLTGSTSDVGIEPWRSDGTASGTSLLRDIAPGDSAYPGVLGRLGDTILFVARDPLHGSELWRTDGTPAGTRLVADINPGPPSSIGGGSIVYHGKLLFAATDGGGKQQIWSTDGTQEGTVPLVTLPLSTSSSSSSAFFIVDDRIVFGASDGVWVTDGTTAGTRHVGNDHMRSAQNLTMAGRRAFFTSAFGLWSTDLEAAPAPVTPDYYQGVYGSLLVIGNRVVYFRQTTAGYEPWVTDGTPAGTMLLRDINPSGSSIEDGNGIVAGGFAYFPANDGVHGRELWCTDGTPAGTTLVKDLNPGSADGLSRGSSFGAAFGSAWFVGNDGHAGGLWITDGTEAGTVKLAATGLNGNPVEFRGKTYFDIGVTSGKLWASDGTPEGTAATEPLVAIQASSTPRSLVAFGPRVFFSARDTLNGAHDYTSDGTTAGTHRLDDSPSGVLPVSYRGSLYFFRDRALYRVDGGAAPVVIAQLLESISSLSVRGGLLYFTTSSKTYVSDGTPAGTAAATGFIPWADATDVAGHLMHVDSTSLQEWAPGAPARTIKLFPGAASSSRLFDLGGIQFFLRKGTNKVEIWRSDASTEGTSLAATIDGTPFPLSFDQPFFAAAAGRVLYLSIDDGVHGFELWRSDGTAAGTFRLGGSLPYDFTPLDERLFFTAEDEHYVRKLWVTDGTSAGTRIVAELGDRSIVGNLTPANSLLFFSADDGEHGNELWVTDGSPGGTHLYDIEPGAAGSSPQRLTAASDKLFFTAHTAANGRELWALPLAGQRISIGDVRASRDATSATLTVSLGAPATEEVTAEWTTVDNVAQAGSDYRAASGTLLFAPGEQQKTISIVLIPNGGFGGNRPLNVRLTRVRGAAALKSLGTILIEQRLAADLEVTMALATGPGADAGDRLVTVRNLGPSSAIDVLLTVRSPWGNNSVRVQEIAAGTSFTKLVSGVSLIGASASSSVPDPNLANNTATTTRIATGPFGLAISIEPGAIAAGQHATLLVVHRGEPAGPKVVKLTSSNPAVLPVPASVTVDADHPVSLDVVAASAGTVDVRATDGYALVVLHLEIAPAGTHPRWPSSLVLFGIGNVSVGLPTTFDAYVPLAAPDTGAIATGTVTFSIDGRPLMGVPLDSTGLARATTDAIPRGTYTLTATYGGDANFLPSSDSADLVVQRGSGVRSFTGSMRRIDAGSAEIHLEVVGGAAAVPTGTVTIAAYQGGPAVVKDAPLVHGTISAVIHQQGQPLTLYVTYSGDENYVPYSNNVTFTPEHVRAAR